MQHQIIPVPAISANEMQYRLVDYGYDYESYPAKIPAVLREVGVSDITPAKFRPTFVQLEIHIKSMFFNNPKCDCEISELDGHAVLQYRLYSPIESYSRELFPVWVVGPIMTAIGLHYKGTLRSHWWVVALFIAAGVLHILALFLTQVWVAWKLGPGMDEVLRMVMVDSECRWRRHGGR